MGSLGWKWLETGPRVNSAITVGKLAFSPFPHQSFTLSPGVMPLTALSSLCPLQAHRRFLQGVTLMQGWGQEVLLIHLRVSPISLPFCL